MKKDPDKEELLQEIDRLKQELRLKSIDLKRTEMARDAYERMIVLAEERYGIPIRKKSDAKHERSALLQLYPCTGQPAEGWLP